MKAMGIIHVIVVWLLTLALASLCVWQWQGSSKLANRLIKTRAELVGAHLDTDLAQQRADRLTETLLESEAKRIEAKQLQAKAEFRLTEVSDMLKDTRRKIGELENQVTRGQARLAETGELIEGIAGVEDAVAQRDEIIRQLETERVDLANQLNERTRLYNELVEEVNRG